MQSLSTSITPKKSPSALIGKNKIIIGSFTSSNDLAIPNKCKSLRKLPISYSLSAFGNIQDSNPGDLITKLQLRDLRDRRTLRAKINSYFKNIPRICKTEQKHSK